MRHRTSKFAEYETHWREWGEPGRPVAVLLHGYTQNGQAFQALARSLGANYHVVCPDALGRGYSSWIDRSAGSYSLSYIAEQMECLIEDLGAEQVRWVGTSMGGIVGLLVASGRLRDRITHLVLNDIGPAFPSSPTRVQETIAERRDNLEFTKFSEIEKFLRESYRENYSAQIDDEEWWHSFVDSLIHRDEKGAFRAHYDPQILMQFGDVLGEYDEWNAYCSLNCRVMVIRGMRSKVLPGELYEEMLERRRPDCTLAVPAAGHAPLLDTPKEIYEINRFFELQADGN